MSNFGLKKIVITVAVLAAVSLGIAGVISVTSGIVSKRGFIGSGEGITIDEEKSYPVSGVGAIKAFSTSSDIQFKEGTGSEIRFHLHGTVRASNEKNITKLVEKASGKTLEVGAEPPRTVLGISSSNLVLDIYLPDSFTGDLDVHSVSGDLALPFGSFKTLSMDTTSGEISFNEIKASSLGLDSTSGDINGLATVEGPVTVETTSGEIDIDGSAESVIAESTSGDISFDLSGIAGDIDIDATSGEIDLTLPKGYSFEMSLKATSGDISSEFPVTIQGSQGGSGNKRLEGTVGEGGFKVSVKTVSGDIVIRQR